MIGVGVSLKKCGKQEKSYYADHYDFAKYRKENSAKLCAFPSLRLINKNHSVFKIARLNFSVVTTLVLYFRRYF